MRARPQAFFALMRPARFSSAEVSAISIVQASSHAAATPVRLVPSKGVTRLHAGFAEVAVVEHHDREIVRLLRANCCEGSQAHQLFAVAGEHQNGLFWLRQRQPSPMEAAPPMAPQR